MAKLVLAFAVEMDLVRDCLDDLMRIHEALTYRHGDRFRSLERRIEAVEEDLTGTEAFGWPEIEPGRMVMTPPPRWVALIEEARALGVI
jgi:hypothetical protein